MEGALLGMGPLIRENMVICDQPTANSEHCLLLAISVSDFTQYLRCSNCWTWDTVHVYVGLCYLVVDESVGAFLSFTSVIHSSDIHAFSNFYSYSLTRFIFKSTSKPILYG